MNLHYFRCLADSDGCSDAVGSSDPTSSGYVGLCVKALVGAGKRMVSN